VLDQQERCCFVEDCHRRPRELGRLDEQLLEAGGRDDLHQARRLVGRVPERVRRPDHRRAEVEG
jgi:hypothetical protein